MKRKEAEFIVKEGLTEEQKRKYRLLDNKTNELATWDIDLLEEELEGLDLGGLDLDWGIGTGEEPASSEKPGISPSPSLNTPSSTVSRLF